MCIYICILQKHFSCFCQLEVALYFLKLLLQGSVRGRRSGISSSNKIRLGQSVGWFVGWLVGLLVCPFREAANANSEPIELGMVWSGSQRVLAIHSLNVSIMSGRGVARIWVWGGSSTNVLSTSSHFTAGGGPRKLAKGVHMVRYEFFHPNMSPGLGYKVLVLFVRIISREARKNSREKFVTWALLHTFGTSLLLPLHRTPGPPLLPTLGGGVRTPRTPPLATPLMSGVGCVLALQSAIFGQFQAQAAGDLAALSTQHLPICQVKQRWDRLVHFWESFLEGAFHYVTFANIVSEVLE